MPKKSMGWWHEMITDWESADRAAYLCGILNTVNGPSICAYHATDSSYDWDGWAARELHYGLLTRDDEGNIVDPGYYVQLVFPGPKYILCDCSMREERGFSTWKKALVHLEELVVNYML